MHKRVGGGGGEEKNIKISIYATWININKILIQRNVFFSTTRITNFYNPNKHFFRLVNLHFHKKKESFSKKKKISKK